MRGDVVSSTDSVAALRNAFDEAFARAPALDTRVHDDLLAIRVAGNPHALRLSAIAGLYVERRIVPVPSDVATLLGLVGLRGELVPVYDLGALLGHPAARDPAWIVLVRAPAGSVGLAFEKLESFLRLSRDALEDAGASASRHIEGLVQTGGGLRPLVDVSSIVEAIAQKEL